MFVITPEEAKKNESNRGKQTKTWIYSASDVRDFAFAASRKFIWDAMGVDVDGDRVLAMDVETARHIARLGEHTHQQPVALADLIIAATAIRHGLTVLTRNISDFSRLSIPAQDPFLKLPPDV